MLDMLFMYLKAFVVGGKPDSAMGGGTDVSKVDDALAAVDDFVASKL